ncbi:MAG: hypothetical protein KUF77_15970 [Candidatus Thiodiazotropha sp. (ex Lucina aurantia)]|nr:hypothetical protein [Candidatus Thiodiazotropha sp. (ex Lucina pensylvanica)]MBT3023646.1 hypothetical protein [Candidatus Thiodiazotropha taylori]MBV2100794.1 hypothetical protein [Candidatus Thiodiazotropha sp. (ex Codakia orbicularis)]MBV2104522.1 hypothetical protein [Candidatus Thiodiazotropha sp. (ex Lucina aurantia)]MBV2119034.1 hypothetical protein [Candidatus Thiodiazotropha sp. (ex Lucina aurantia)]
MNTIDKWAERVYTENDFGRSVATSVAGIVGLVVYLIIDDWVIAAFSSIIAFPVVRLVAKAFHDKVTRNARRRIEQEEAEIIYDRLSNDEKEVVQAFVKAGGTALTWGHVNDLCLPMPAVESLLQREILWTSFTADGLRETFALDTAVFDVGQHRQKQDENL